MDANKKTFNFTTLFIVVYAILAIIVLLFIWWPKDKLNNVNGNFKYSDVDEEQMAIDIYKTELTPLLSKKNMDKLYEKLNYNYMAQNSITKDNYKSFLETCNYISDSVNIIECSVSRQGNDIYIYKFKYSSNNEIHYVNLIESFPYEYSLSFEQDTIPIVDNTSSISNIENNSKSEETSNNSNTKTSVIDDIVYEIKVNTIRDNGISYTLKITNNSDKNAEYNFDNITNVSAIMSDGKIANMGGTVISSEEDIVTPNGSLEKDLFFAISSQDQYKIKTIRILNAKIGEEKNKEIKKQKEIIISQTTVCS